MRVHVEGISLDEKRLTQRGKPARPPLGIETCSPLNYVSNAELHRLDSFKSQSTLTKPLQTLDK